jgi:hypothetical protein
MAELIQPTQYHKSAPVVQDLDAALAKATFVAGFGATVADFALAIKLRDFVVRLLGSAPCRPVAVR